MIMDPLKMIAVDTSHSKHANLVILSAVLFRHDKTQAYRTLRGMFIVKDGRQLGAKQKNQT